MEAVPPMPVLPEMVKVLRVELPETDREEVPTDPNIPAEETFKEAPIPVLPDVDRVDSWVLPATLTDDEKLAPEVTVRDDPTPTFPVVVKVELLMSVAFKP